MSGKTNLTTRFSPHARAILLIGIASAVYAAGAETIDKPARMFCRSNECSWPQTLEMPAAGGKFELRCRSSQYPYVDNYSFKKSEDTTCNEWQTRRESRIVACRAKDGVAQISELVLQCRMRGG